MVEQMQIPKAGRTLEQTVPKRAVDKVKWWMMGALGNKDRQLSGQEEVLGGGGGQAGGFLGAALGPWAKLFSVWPDARCQMPVR